MKAARNATIVLLMLGLAGTARGQSGQVKFRGTVTADEVNNVVPVCYGDYHVTVAIDKVMEDPNAVLTMRSVQVCYKVAAHLVAGMVVEVNGYYWGGGSCPKQYCGRVQILTKSDYITPLGGYGGAADWMVLGDLMHAIPSGNVGIGTDQPRDKLHVVGNLLLENVPSVWMRLVSELGQDAGLGLIAEEVGRVVPEVVDYEANGADARSLAYDRLVALLIEALKEQQTKIVQLEQAVARNRDLEQRLDALERWIQPHQKAPSLKEGTSR